MKISELTSSEKAKRFLNKKMLLGITAVVMGVAIIFVCSIVPLAIDPSQWNSAGFISDEIINVALVIMGEVSLIMIGQSYNAATDVSKLAKARVSFNQSLEENIGKTITAFDQWIRQVLEPHDQQDKYERLMNYEGLENHKYLDLDRSELETLRKHAIKKEEVYYRQLNKRQYQLIIDILDGKQTIHFIDASSWRKNSKFDTDKTPSEKMANQQKKTTNTVLISVISKSIMVVASGLVFGALIPTGTDQTVGQTLIKLFTRLFCFSSSAFMGFFVGCQINDIDADYLMEKVNIHIAYKTDINFKPLSEQELAKKEFVEYVKKENQDYMKQLDNKSNQLELKEQK